MCSVRTGRTVRQCEPLRFCWAADRELGEPLKALVYHGPGEKRWESKPDPGIEQPEDLIVRIDTTTICGTDLHILKVDVPTVEEGRTLGNEAVGTVVEPGSAVRDIEEGDRVLRQFGADMTVDNSSEDAVEKVMEATDGLGAD